MGNAAATIGWTDTSDVRRRMDDNYAAQQRDEHRQDEEEWQLFQQNRNPIDPIPQHKQERPDTNWEQEHRLDVEWEKQQSARRESVYLESERKRAVARENDLLRNRIADKLYQAERTKQLKQNGEVSVSFMQRLSSMVDKQIKEQLAPVHSLVDYVTAAR